MGFSRGYPAIVGPSGSWIRVFYWDRESTSNIFRDDVDFINVGLWTPGAGLQVLNKLPPPQFCRGGPGIWKETTLCTFYLAN